MEQSTRTNVNVPKRSCLWSPFKLETVTIFIGILNAMASAATFIMFQTALSEPWNRKAFMVAVLGSSDVDGWNFIVWVLWVGSMIYFIFSLTLIYGIVKKYVLFVQAFYIFAILFLFTCLMMSVSTLVLAMFERNVDWAFVSIRHFTMYGLNAVSLYIIRLTIHKMKKQKELPSYRSYTRLIPSADSPPNYHEVMHHLPLQIEIPDAKVLCDDEVFNDKNPNLLLAKLTSAQTRAETKVDCDEETVEKDLNTVLTDAMHALSRRIESPDLKEDDNGDSGSESDELFTI